MLPFQEVRLNRCAVSIATRPPPGSRYGHGGRWEVDERPARMTLLFKLIGKQAIFRDRRLNFTISDRCRVLLAYRLSESYLLPS